jgi:O-antigen/teichoic acid export membrane protein
LSRTAPGQRRFDRVSLFGWARLFHQAPQAAASGQSHAKFVSINRRIAFGAASMWLNRGIIIALRLVLIPVLFHNRPKEEVGIWMLLGQTWALVGILDLGFSATLTRRIALAKGKSGTDPNGSLSEETRLEIADLIESGRRICLWLAIGAFVVCAGAGFLYLRQLHVHSLSLSTMCIAWGILCLSSSLGVWSEVWIWLMQGLGYIGWEFAIASGLDVLTILAQIVAVLMGGGLVALAITMAVGPVVLRFFLLRFARKWRPELFTTRGKWNAALLRSLISPSLRAWMTSLGIFVVMYSDPYLIAQLNGASQIPAYRAAWLIFFNLNALSMAAALASAAFVSHLWQAGHFDEIQRMVIRNLRFGLSIVVCGGACVLVLGPRLFNLWLGRGNFAGYPLLAIFFVIFFLETQATIISSCSRATEDEVFAPWAIAAGTLKIILSLALGVRFGLTGIALGTLLALALTNHWFMAYRGLRRLRMSVWQHGSRVLLPVGLVFAGTGAMVWLVEQTLRDAPAWTTVVAGVTAAGLILAAALWTLTLDKSERARALIYLSLKPSR